MLYTEHEVDKNEAEEVLKSVNKDTQCTLSYYHQFGSLHYKTEAKCNGLTISVEYETDAANDMFDSRNPIYLYPIMKLGELINLSDRKKFDILKAASTPEYGQSETRYIIRRISAANHKDSGINQIEK